MKVVSSRTAGLMTVLSLLSLGILAVSLSFPSWIYRELIAARLGVKGSLKWWLGLAYSSASFLVWVAYAPTYFAIRSGLKVKPQTWAMFGLTNLTGLLYAIATKTIPLAFTMLPATFWCSLIIFAHWREQTIWEPLHAALMVKADGELSKAEAAAQFARLQRDLLQLRESEQQKPNGSLDWVGSIVLKMVRPVIPVAVDAEIRRRIQELLRSL